MSVLHLAVSANFSPLDYVGTFGTSYPGACIAGRIDMKEFLDEVEGHLKGLLEGLKGLKGSCV